MLGLSPGVKIFIATASLDMRKSFDAMAAIVEKQLHKDVYAGHLFVFFNKRVDRIKLFYWDSNGYCFWYKRLEQGRYRLPRMSDTVYSISTHELNLLLEGIDLTHRQRLRVC